MSKTFSRSVSSAGVSRSKSRVPRPARFMAAATARLRGLWRLLPEPWAKTTTAPAPGGTVRSPASASPPASTTTSAGRRSTGSCAACVSRVRTSSSGVWVKSRYHSPTARKARGVDRQTTSSAWVRSQATASGGATGTASTTRAAPCARTTSHAAAAVAPVAIPSSTTITDRPSSGTRGRSPRNRRA